MSLKDIEIENRYRSSQNPPIEFYVKCFTVATKFDRAAGYFSSSGLADAAKGLAHFLHNDGKIRIVVSPYLDEKDANVIENHINNISNELDNILIRSIEHVEEGIISDRLNILAWMLSEKKLDIKIAIRMVNGKVTNGIYHEKMGIFYF